MWPARVACRLTVGCVRPAGSPPGQPGFPGFAHHNEACQDGPCRIPEPRVHRRKANAERLSNSTHNGCSGNSTQSVNRQTLDRHGPARPPEQSGLPLAGEEPEGLRLTGQPSVRRTNGRVFSPGGWLDDSGPTISGGTPSRADWRWIDRADPVLEAHRRWSGLYTGNPNPTASNSETRRQQTVRPSR